MKYEFKRIQIKSKKKGFTLIELMAVIALIALLSVIMFPNAISTKTFAKESKLETNQKTVDNYLYTQYDVDNRSLDTIKQNLKNAFNNKLENPYTYSKSVDELVLNGNILNLQGANQSISLGVVDLTNSANSGINTDDSNIKTLVKNSNLKGSVVAFLLQNGTYKIASVTENNVSIIQPNNPPPTDPGNGSVLFSIVNNNGIPIMRLNPGMDINKDYVVNFEGTQITITKDKIGMDGSLAAIPKSLAQSIQVSFADANPLKFSNAKGIDTGMSSGDTPPEVAIQNVSQEDDAYYKVDFNLRDLDKGDNVILKYRILDINTNIYLSSYPSDMNILDELKTNDVQFLSDGKILSLNGYVKCPIDGDFKVEIWAVDASGTKSQTKYFRITS